MVEDLSACSQFLEMQFKTVWTALPTVSRRSHRLQYPSAVLKLRHSLTAKETGCDLFVIGCSGTAIFGLHTTLRGRPTSSNRVGACLPVRPEKCCCHAMFLWKPSLPVITLQLFVPALQGLFRRFQQNDQEVCRRRPASTSALVYSYMENRLRWKV